MRNLIAVLLSLAFLSQTHASASPLSDTLGNCLKDNTSGKERKELARWVFLSMTVHPEMRSLSHATDATRTESSKAMAALVTRLLTTNCKAEARAAFQAKDPQGLQSAFASLGQVAMMELTTNPDVAAAVGGYVQFLDTKKLEALILK